jgi:uncharacterized protein (DUF885 family)
MAAILACISCGRTAPAADPLPADGNSDARLKQTLSAYVVEFLRRNPTTNTYLGGAGLDSSLREVDGRLRDHSAKALEDEDRWLEGVRKALEAIAPDSLSPAGRIDREVALAQIRFLLHQHQVRRYQERALDTYTSEPFRALDWQLQGMTANGTGLGTADEWRLVVARIRAIPAFLATAREQLSAGVRANHLPDPRMLRRDGLGTSEANAKYFAETLPALAAERITGSERGSLSSDLRAAGRHAADAYLSFRDFLASTFFDGASIKPAFSGDRYAMGEEEYNWALKNNLRIDRTAAQLYEEAWPVVEQTQREMIDLARAIGTRRAWTLPADGAAAVRAVFDELSKDYPKSDTEMIAWYRETAFRLVEYGRTTGMFDVPADYKLDVVETPPPLQASIDGAAYYPAPPFRNSGVG